jgi:hypothetical protein
MGKIQLRARKAADWSIDEISISAEQLYYQLKTIVENGSSMEKDQLFNLTEIAWNISGDINAWMQAEEERQIDKSN